MSDPKLLNVKEACSYLGGVSRSTLYREMKRGRIKKSTKVGGVTFFRESELDRYLRANERDHAA